MKYKEVHVDYRYLDDLYFRAGCYLLSAEVYIIDFVDWLKNNAAYNTNENGGFPIARYFEALEVLESNEPVGARQINDMSIMIVSFYDYIVSLYNRNFTSFNKYGVSQNVERRGRRSKTVSFDFESTSVETLFIPSFDKAMDRLKSMGFIPKVVSADGYVSPNDDAIMSTVASALVRDIPRVYQVFSIIYDNSSYSCSRNMCLLGVTF